MIRSTTPADVAEIVALTEGTGFFRPMEIVALQEVMDDFFAVNHQENHQCVTMEEGGRLVAFAYYAPAAMTDRTWYLYWIAVRNDVRGQGHGGLLLRHVEEDIRDRHKGRLLFIETGSVKHYEPTRAFYRKQGYEEHAVLKDFYMEGDSMVVFRKNFSQSPG